jgi:hypothetical protein
MNKVRLCVRHGVKAGGRMKKSFLLFAVLILSLSAAHSWDINNKTASITNYASASKNVNVTFTVSRLDSVGAVPFYILVSGVTIGADYLPGVRKTFLGGAVNASSLEVFIRPSGQTVEIGSIDQAGTMVVSGTVPDGRTSTTVVINVATGTGRVPKGTYTNIFVLQLYTGSLNPGEGTFQSGATGNLTVSVASSTTSTFSISLSPTSVSFGNSMVPDTAYTATSSMLVTAPATFSISARSLRSGLLLNANLEDTIPYHFYFNNEPTEVNLGSGLVSLIYSTTAVTNKTYPLRFETDALGFIEPGLYSDTLYFMFTTQ